MAKITLTEADQDLLRLLSMKQAGAVLHRLIGKECSLDAEGEQVFLSIQTGVLNREKDAKRKRNLHGNSMEVPRNLHGKSVESHKTAPPFLPPLSSPPTPPVTHPPYNPPTATTTAGAIGLFLDKINPTPSEYCRTELVAFVQDLGNELVERVISYANDNKCGTWPYIRTILRDCKRCGLDSIEAWDKREEERERRKQRGAAANEPARFAAADADETWGIRGTVIGGN